MIPDNEQQRIADTFATAVSGNLTAVAKEFIQRFNSVLSLELTCRMCAAYDNHPQFRPYYRTSLIVSAQKIIDRAWALINVENKTERQPVLFLIGGGPGSFVSELTDSIPRSILDEVNCVYDLLVFSVTRADDLITRTIQERIPVIIAYVYVSLQQAAQSAITASTLQGVLPTAKEFGARHVACYNTFLVLTGRHKRKNALFNSLLISVYGNQIVVDVNSQKLERLSVKSSSAEQAFLAAWNTLQNSGDQAGGPTEQPLVIKQRRDKSKNPLRNRSARAGYLLAQTLNVVHEQRLSRIPPAPPPGNGRNAVDANSESLNHRRTFASAKVLEEATGWNERTLPGQERLLNNERPLRLVVQEKKTHEHEMEIVYTR